jgi:hypothetical protein
MADKKDIYQTGPLGKPPGGSPELPNQQSIELLIGLLQNYQRRTNQSTIPPEVERDIAIVNAVVDSIRTALALGANKTTISSVNPATGSSDGGSTVTITGSNLLPGAKVRFGPSAARSVTVDSLTQIRATTPPGTGTVDVVVSTLGGAARRANGFTYQSQY